MDGVDEQITSRVARGESIARMAADLGLSVHAVRRRLRALGLETARSAVLRANREARDRGQRTIERACPRHGVQSFRLMDGRTMRCPRCASERVAVRRRRIKEMLVAEAGACCALCGYDRCTRALEFHHLDPATKEFGVAAGGHSRGIARARAEVAKCTLLCANCHAEVEAGVRRLSLSLAFRSGVAQWQSNTLLR